MYNTIKICICQAPLESNRSIIPRYRKAVVPGTHTAENHDFISSDQGSKSSTSPTLLGSVGSGKCRKLSFLPGVGAEPQRAYFSVIIFFRSAIVLFISEEVSSSLVTLSQELMIVEWSRPKASPMRGRLRPVISRVR